MQIGAIVRRKAGWTPMRISSASGHSYMARYCGADSDEDIPFESHRFELVRNPALEFQGCPNWPGRLTDDDKLQLQRQLHPTAAPLPWLHQPPKDQETSMSSNLYQTNEATPRFGTKLAINSAGKVVLEMKGTGAVEMFAPGDLEKVVPYTVDMVFMDGSSTVYSFLSRPNDVTVGDIVLVADRSSVGRVVAVNTKSPKATKTLRGRKVMTAEFGPDSDDAIDLTA